MEPILPTWFKYRQGKAEVAGENTCRLTAPNLSEAFISIRAIDNGKWQGVVRLAADGPELAASSRLDSPSEAWKRRSSCTDNTSCLGRLST